MVWRALFCFGLLTLMGCADWVLGLGASSSGDDDDGGTDTLTAVPSPGDDDESTGDDDDGSIDSPAPSPGPTETQASPGPTETPASPGPTETPASPGPTETPVCGGSDPDESEAGDACVYLVDNDGDGFGGTDAVACEAGEGLVAARGDCDDVEPSIHPGADDASDDGIDQDCGGTEDPDPHVGLSPSSYASIEEALEAAQDGETVWVGPGTYCEQNLSFGGTAIRLISTHFASSTIIDAQLLGRVFSFDKSGETWRSVLDGFSVTNGLAPSGEVGGGIYIDGASPTLQNCSVTGNTAQNGGGIYMNDSSSTLTFCEINQNTAYESGGGIYLLNSQVRLAHCRLEQNESQVDNGGGGAIYGRGDTVDTANLSLSNCLIADNTALNRGGGIDLEAVTATLEHCLILRNTTTLTEFGSTEDQKDGYGGGVYLSESNATLRNCRLSENKSNSQGAGLYLDSSSASVYVIQNCVITNNELPNDPDDPYKDGGGIHVHGQYATTPKFLSSIVAYNEEYALVFADGYASTPDPDLSSTDLYSIDQYYCKGGDECDPPVSYLSVDPMFLSYADLVPIDFHLDPDSPLLNMGAPDADGDGLSWPDDCDDQDPDGSRTDLGIYGGPAGDGWDQDADGYPDWFWPGSLEDAPVGFNTADYDADDQDPTRH